MKHFPIYVATEGRRIVLAGGGDAALAKLRLLMKTEARLTVFAADPAPEIVSWADHGALALVRRRVAPGDADGALLLYAASGDAAEDARAARIGQAGGALVNIVDNLEDSAFITPAIVDRDPVTVAIGTEGAAPVLARAIKAQIEARLPSSLGILARIGKAFRGAAEALPPGRLRRDFWSDYYFGAGPRGLDEAGEAGAKRALESLLESRRGAAPGPGQVAFVGAGPGDPELLTLRARRELDAADVVIHDRLAAPEILELARREARIIEAGKRGYGPSAAQEDINRLMVRHARAGARVVRLKGGDPATFGRLDEEIAALEAAGVAHVVVPGVTAASAAAAAIRRSLTRRGRNSATRQITGRGMRGFAEHDWRALARPGEVAAIYMGVRAARFVQGRLMMHGADRATPATIVESASRPQQRIAATTLADLADDVARMDPDGPALILYGVAPAQARAERAAQQPMEARHGT